MVELLRRLALAESPSLGPAAQQPVFELLTERLVALDFAVRRVPGRLTGGVLYARPHGRQRAACRCSCCWATATRSGPPARWPRCPSPSMATSWLAPACST